MYKNILFVSDNLALCKQIMPLINSFQDRTFQFSTSPFSDQNLFSKELGLEVLVINMKDNDTIEQVIKKYDLIISIHCKQIFPKSLIEAVKCINVHPGYNPINRGWYPQVFSIINNLPVGATIHEIDEKLDHGKIIDRSFVEKSNIDTSLTLYQKITAKEIELFAKNLENILNNTYSSVHAEDEGNLFLRKDFNDLCYLDLNRRQTIGETINHLRALTHGDFKNAFFIDPDTGKKVFVSINLSLERL